jgi:hypothetical protein
MDNNLDCYDSNTVRLQTPQTPLISNFNFFLNLTIRAYVHMRIGVGVQGRFRPTFNF